MNALNGPDQLRQRVAFALSQILVVSSRDIFDGPAMAIYVDLLTNHAFGNFRQLLEAITLNPAMGNYLDMVNNDKPNPATGRTANENYARELLQLFSIGVFKLNPNGTLKLDPAAERRGHAHPDLRAAHGRRLRPRLHGLDLRHGPAQPAAHELQLHAVLPRADGAVPSRHDTNTKEVLDGVVLPAGRDGRRRTWPPPSTRSSTTRTSDPSSAASSSSTW